MKKKVNLLCHFCLILRSKEEKKSQMNKIIAMIHLLNTKINYLLKSSRIKKGLNDITTATFSMSFFQLLAMTSLGAVHKGRSQIIPYFWPLPPSCLQPSAIQGPLTKKDFCKSGIWLSIFWKIDKIQLCHEKTRKVGTLLYEIPSNYKGKNFVSKIYCYCPQNTME